MFFIAILVVFFLGVVTHVTYLCIEKVYALGRKSMRASRREQLLMFAKAFVCEAITSGMLFLGIFCANCFLDVVMSSNTGHFFVDALLASIAAKALLSAMFFKGLLDFRDHENYRKSVVPLWGIYPEPVSPYLQIEEEK